MDKIQNINKEFYNRRGKAWADIKTHSFWHEGNFRKFIKYFKSSDKIIELGSAHGICVPLFLGIGRHLNYTGVDISKSLLAIARRRYPHLKFKESNILDYSTLPKDTFDGFWASAIMMHIPEEDWPKMLENIEKIIKPGGVGYITLPQRRPNPASKKDQRYFSFWNLIKLNKFIELRGWKILQHGKMPDRVARWQWFIVKLPK